MNIGEESFTQSSNIAVKEYINELCKVGVVKDPNKLTDEEKSIIQEGCDHIIKTYEKCCRTTTPQETTETLDVMKTFVDENNDRSKPTDTQAFQ